MALRAPSLEELFSWLHRRGIYYAVLRDVGRLSDEWPRSDRADDVDLLIDDEAAPDLHARFSSCRSGVKLDLYGVEGRFGTDYHGYAHLPERLSRQILTRRRPVEQRFYAPLEGDELDALLYHAAYHKSMQSELPLLDPGALQSGPYTERLRRLIVTSGVDVPLALAPMHEYLVARGLGVSDERLAAYIQHDFRHGRKSYFHATLCAKRRGEMNLFVIREVAVKHARHEDLLGRLAERYRILRSKWIPWRVRFATRKGLRGGRWRRGGKPRIAVVVFDPSPEATSETERSVHPFVFNRNQFIKTEWRAWFSRDTRARVEDNPIHSTDNEAEAIGHLPLFFSKAEEQEIYVELARLRSEG